MEQYIPKAAVVAEIESILNETNYKPFTDEVLGERKVCKDIKDFLNTFEVKDVGLMLHTIIAECCDWLAMNTELSHNEIEGCRNLMLTVKEEQCKAQKGE